MYRSERYDVVSKRMGVTHMHAHNKVLHNEKADELAKAGAQMAKPPPPPPGNRYVLVQAAAGVGTVSIWCLI